MNADETLLVTGHNRSVVLWDIVEKAKLSGWALSDKMELPVNCRHSRLVGDHLYLARRDGLIRRYPMGPMAGYTGDRGIYIAAALRGGLGTLSHDERNDLLMSEAPQNLYDAYEQSLLDSRTTDLPPKERTAMQVRIRNDILSASRALRSPFSNSGDTRNGGKG